MIKPKAMENLDWCWCQDAPCPARAKGPGKPDPGFGADIAKKGKPTQRREWPDFRAFCRAGRRAPEAMRRDRNVRHQLSGWMPIAFTTGPQRLLSLTRK